MLSFCARCRGCRARSPRELFDPGDARLPGIDDLQRTTRLEAAAKHREHDRVEKWQIVAVEGAVDENRLLPRSQALSCLRGRLSPFGGLNGLLEFAHREAGRLEIRLGHQNAFLRSANELTVLRRSPDRHRRLGFGRFAHDPYIGQNAVAINAPALASTSSS